MRSWLLGASATTLLLLCLLSPGAAAHACYVLVNNSTSTCPREGPDGAMLADGLTGSPLVPLALGALLAAPLLAFPALARVERRHGATLARLRAGAEAYARDFLPLVLRAGLGVALVAGASRDAFLSPLVPRPIGVAFALVGGLLLLGLFTRWAALAAAGYFLGALPGTPSLLGNVEALTMALALGFLLPPGRPSLDDWLANARVPVPGAAPPLSASAAPRAALALRLALAATLAYGALAEKLLDPHLMARVAESHGMAGFLGVPASGWVVLVGAGELAFAFALLAGFEVRLTALALAFTVLGMTVTMGESLALHATLLAAALGVALAGPSGFALEVRARVVTPQAAPRDEPRAALAAESP